MTSVPEPGECDWIAPSWGGPSHVRALFTTRNGGVSGGPAASMDIGPAHASVADLAGAIGENRRRLRARLPSEPVWMSQVHGREVARVDAANAGRFRSSPPQADAAVTCSPGVVLTVRTADCLPVLFADRAGSVIAVAHAGWRGLAAGVLEATLDAMGVAASQIVAWIGPCIGPDAFEVGADVFDTYHAPDPGSAVHFKPLREGKWLADLPGLARRRLSRLGIDDVAGGAWCTHRDAERFSRTAATSAAVAWRSWHGSSGEGRYTATRLQASSALARTPRIALSTLAFIVAAALAGGILATAAAALTLALPAGWISRLVSFAVGALLGAVFIELLPHALETGDAGRVMATVLAGLLAFFLLEKLVLWRHSHGHAEHRHDEEESEHDHALHAPGDGGRSGLMILIGNSVHNFCDGIVIAAAFLVDLRLGVATTVAIVAHAVPQQVGDFAVLIHSGFTRGRAFAFNMAAGAAMLAGALAGYVALAGMQEALPTVLAVAAASLLYVAVADLIPSLHRRPEAAETARQMLAIGLGVAIIAGVHLLFEH